MCLCPCVMTAAFATKEEFVQTTSRAASPAGNSSDSNTPEPDGSTAPALIRKQPRRAVNRNIESTSQCLMRVKASDNGGGPKLTRPCDGLSCMCQHTIVTSSYSYEFLHFIQTCCTSAYVHITQAWDLDLPTAPVTFSEAS